MSEAKWVEFRLDACQPPKTQRWEVVAKDGGEVLGTVKWWGAWRKYTFHPLAATLYEPTCLRDIAAFCEEQTTARKR
jgi:hypothetical protein